MNSPAEVQFVGLPDGKEIFVPEFGCKTRLFTIEPGGNGAAIMFHVPLEFRGDYRPAELANYDSEKDYRTDDYGKALCTGKTARDRICNRRAINRYPYCNAHGGRVHPLDKLIKEQAPEDVSISRYQQYKCGQITVDDLDDEELALCGFKDSRGRIFRPRNVPREITQAFQKALFERANAQLKSLVVDAAQTIGEIMKNKTIEPDIRLKAALSLIERNLGKTPQVVAITDAKGYEEIFDEIIHVRSERPEIESTSSVIEAEVVEPSDNSRGTDSTGFDRTETEIHSVATPLESSGQNVGDIGHIAQPIDRPNKSQRGHERNEAILAQSVEIKAFEYDLTDKRKDIKKATQKRYASRALGVDLTLPSVPYTVIKEKVSEDIVNIRWIEPAMPKVPKAKTSDSKRKTFTLSDFNS